MFPWKARSKSLTGRNKPFYPNIVRVVPGAGSRLIWYDKTLKLASKHNILEPIARKRIISRSRQVNNDGTPEAVSSDSSAVNSGSSNLDSRLESSGSSSSDSSMDRHCTVQYQHNDSASQYSGSSALDRCYVGGKGFSRFLKHQIHQDVWSDSATESSFLRSSYMMLPDVHIGETRLSSNSVSTKAHSITQPCYKYASIQSKIQTGDKFPTIHKPQYTITISTSGRVISKPSTANEDLRSVIERNDNRRFQSCFARFQPATTTQAAPYSSADLIGSYNNSDTRLTSTEDLRLTNGSYSDRRGKLGKDSSEGRPSKKNNIIKASSSKASSSVDKEKDKEREKDNRDRNKDIKDLEGGGGPILPPTNNKVPHTNYSNFRPMNARNNFLGGQQINPLPSQQRCSTQQSSNTSSSQSDRRDSDDLVAMGTNPLYGRGGRPREGSFNNGNGIFYSQSSSGALGSVRKFSKPNAFTRTKDSEPRYSDPLLNAPPTFNQRLAEIASLEQETIRYERTKKFRKKKSETT